MSSTRRFNTNVNITNGNVGINTNNPVSYLHINSSNNTQASICINQTSGAAILIGAIGTAADHLYPGSIVITNNKNFSCFHIGKNSANINSIGFTFNTLADNSSTNYMTSSWYGGNTSLNVNGKGFIGLNNGAPNNMALWVNGSSSISVGGGYYMNSGGAGTYSAGNQPMSVFANGRIVSLVQLEANSDIRIKNNIEPVQTSFALDIIRQLNPVQYKYIDQIQHGNRSKYGFIAQEVDKVVDDCVSKVSDYIPDILKLCNVVNNNTLIFDDDSQQENIKIGDKLKLYDNKNKETIVTVNEIINKCTFVVDKELEHTSYCVYGKHVDDFHVLNYDSVFALGTAALKELYSDFESLQDIDNRDSIISSLESQISLLGF